MQGFHYKIATVEDLDDIVDLLARVFSESEPPTVAMGLTYLEMKQFLRLITPEIIPASVTVIAREKDSGDLAGVLLTDDFAAPPHWLVSQNYPTLANCGLGWGTQRCFRKISRFFRR